MKLRNFLLLTLFYLAGCGQEIVLPPAQPLTANDQQLAGIPALERGAYTISKSAPLAWRVGQRSLRIRLIEPAGDGPFPLAIFSHGFASDIDKYDALLEHWASHGYLSIAPYHRDGGGMLRGIFNSLREGNDGLIAARVADIKLILDHLPELDALIPGLYSRIDRQRIAVTGHSFGAFTAQQFGGAAAVDPETGARIEARDERIRAVVSISPPGEMFGLINQQSWLAMDVPMLATTGTWDVDGRFVTDWRQHALSYESALPGKNWLLVVEGADHYLGNLICRPEREEAPQHDALRMVNAVAVSFLNAQLKDDPIALEFLNTERLRTLTLGFAQITQR